jgi:hypothetical protein
MKLLFDNNAFASISQQPEWDPLYALLEESVNGGTVKVIGCCTLLEELTGLAYADYNLYVHTLFRYESLTKRQVVNNWNQLVKSEKV